MNRGQPLTERIVPAIDRTGARSMAGKADRATGVVPHEEIARSFIDILVVRVMTATALDVTVNQLDRGVFCCAVRNKVRHEIGGVFERKLQAEGMRAFEMSAQHVGNLSRHFQRADPNRLADGNRAVVTAQALRTVIAARRLNGRVLVRSTGVEGVALVRECLVPQGVSVAAVRYVAVDAGISVRTSNAGGAAHVVGTQYFLVWLRLCSRK